MTLTQTLQWLSQKLYPKGRAFRMPEPSTGSGELYKLHEALNVSIGQAYTDAVQILNDILPDNPSFTIDDAHDWYRRLGIYDSGTVPLSDMKLAIAQKLSFPITPLNKQNYLFIQQQLRAAGFDVYVYENRFSDGMGGYITYTPGMALGINANRAISGFVQHGQVQHGEIGSSLVSVVANYIEESKDVTFNIGSNYRSTFFISGPTLNTYASVPVSRHDEFRQLILKLKPAQTVGLLFINYI